MIIKKHFFFQKRIHVVLHWKINTCNHHRRKRKKEPLLFHFILFRFFFYPELRSEFTLLHQLNLNYKFSQFQFFKQITIFVLLKFVHWCRAKSCFLITLISIDQFNRCRIFFFLFFSQLQLCLMHRHFILYQIIHHESWSNEHWKLRGSKINVF